jgi:hypothetical protein
MYRPKPINQRKANQTFLLILIFAIALICGIANAQPKDQEHYLAFSAGFDIRNATIGSKVTTEKPAFDLLYQFAMVSKNIEVNIGYERFNDICFDKMTFGVGYHFPLYGRIGNTVIKTVLIPSIEPTLIGRWGNEWECRSSHLSIGGNLALRWHLSDKIALELLSNFLPRTDLSARYPEIHSSVPVINSYFLKIIYKIQR